MNVLEQSQDVVGVAGWDDADMIPAGLEPELNVASTNRIPADEALDLLQAWNDKEARRKVDEIARRKAETETRKRQRREYEQERYSEIARSDPSRSSSR